jgi:hypothetical protein
MPIYEKPVRLLMKDFVKDIGVTKGQVFSRDQVLEWFKTNYSLIKVSTVSAHLIRMSTNAPSRFHYNANPNGDDDLFFQIDSKHFRLYDPAKDPPPIYDGESKSRTKRKVVREGFSFFDDVEHPVLKARLSRLSNAPLDTIIREAGVIFESSLRAAGNVSSRQIGVKLVDELLEPGGKLVFSSHGGEQQGVQYLFRGAMQFIRNPPMHKIIDYPESVARQYLRLIDSLLLLLNQATLKGQSSKTSERKQWDEITFFEEATKKCKPAIVETMKMLFVWANKVGSVGFGTGAVSGSFTLYLERNGERSSVFSIYTEGTLTLYSQNIEKIFSAEEIVQFKSSLAKIPELRGFKTYKRYSFSKKMENVFLNKEYLSQFIDCVEGLR